MSREILLSDREVQVVRLLLQGKRNKHIADELGLSLGTIKQYFQRIFHKTGADGRVQLMAWALGKGDITLRRWEDRSRGIVAECLFE